MQSLTGYAPPGQPLPDFFSCMKLILERTRAWYTRCLTAGKEAPKKSSDPLVSPASSPSATRESDEFEDERSRQEPGIGEDVERSPDAGTLPQDYHMLGDSGCDDLGPGALDGLDMGLFTEGFDDMLWSVNLFDPSMFPEMGRSGY